MDCVFLLFSLSGHSVRVFTRPLFVAFLLLVFIFKCNSVSTDFTVKKKNQSKHFWVQRLALGFICIWKCITEVHGACANQARCCKREEMANVDSHRVSLAQTTERRKESGDCSSSFFLLTRMGRLSLALLVTSPGKICVILGLGLNSRSLRSLLWTGSLLMSVGVGCFMFLSSFCDLGSMEVILSLPIHLLWWCLPFKLVCCTEWVPTKLSDICFFSFFSGSNKPG